MLLPLPALPFSCYALFFPLYVLFDQSLRVMKEFVSYSFTGSLHCQVHTPVKLQIIANFATLFSIQQVFTKNSVNRLYSLQPDQCVI